MFDWKEFDKTKHIFSHAGPSLYREEWGQHKIDIRPVDLIRWIDLLKEDLDYLSLVDIVAVDRRSLPVFGGYDFEVVYHLLNMGTHQRLNLHLHVNASEMIPTITGFFPNSEWMEKEQVEMLGLNFSNHPSSLLLPNDQKNFPLKKDAQIKDWKLDDPAELPLLRKNPNKSEAPYAEEAYVWEQFGILSPETLGKFEWTVCFDPQNVVESRLRIGFHHQGLEKLLEKKEWIQVMQLVDKLQPGAAPTYSIAWAKNLEDMLRIKLPERTQAVRIVMLELARIAEHLTVMAEMTLAAGHDEFKHYINAREKVYELFEKYCGQRQGFSIVRLGGLKEDLPHGWIAEYQSVADILNKNLLMIHKSLMSQRKFREHLEVSPVNAQTVLQWGVSGPAMRASGLNFDLRKSQPFYFYQDIDFDIPVGIYGTAYDRYLIRFEEIFQSLRIITQVIDNLPLGEVINPLYDLPYPELCEYMRTQEVASGWHYSGLESPNGEAGFFHLVGNDFQTARIKIKSPSLTLAQAVPQFLKGLNKKQLRASLASLGIRHFEMDR